MEGTVLNRTPLSFAVANGHVKVAELLLSQLADLSVRGYSDLHSAVDHGHTEMAELLLSYGAIVNAKYDRDGRTPLHYAARRGDYRTIRLLVANGADTTDHDKEMKTPRDLAEDKEAFDKAARAARSDEPAKQKYFWPLLESACFVFGSNVLLPSLSISLDFFHQVYTRGGRTIFRSFFGAASEFAAFFSSGYLAAQLRTGFFFVLPVSELALYIFSSFFMEPVWLLWLHINVNGLNVNGLGWFTMRTQSKMVRLTLTNLGALRVVAAAVRAFDIYFELLTGVALHAVLTRLLNILLPPPKATPTRSATDAAAAGPPAKTSRKGRSPARVKKEQVQELPGRESEESTVSDALTRMAADEVEDRTRQRKTRPSPHRAPR